MQEVERGDGRDEEGEDGDDDGNKILVNGSASKTPRKGHSSWLTRRSSLIPSEAISHAMSAFTVHRLLLGRMPFGICFLTPKEWNAISN